MKWKLFLLIRQTLRTLKNGNVTGRTFQELWHLMTLKLRIIDFFLWFLGNFFLETIFNLYKNFLCKYWDQIYWKMTYYVICQGSYFSVFFNKFFSSFDVLRLPLGLTFSASIYPPQSLHIYLFFLFLFLSC